MKALSASDLLHIWDWGQGQSPAAQALLMLSVVYPEVSPQRLADLSIGQRDGQLLNLRSQTFGPQLQATARCPQCAETLEYSLSVQDIVVSSSELPRLTTDKQASGEEAAGEPTVYDWQEGDFAVRFRLPTSADIIAVSKATRGVSGEQAEEAGTTALLERCLVSVCEKGEAISLSSLPLEILNLLEEKIAQEDPQAEILLDLSCLACGRQWQVLFDIVDFFWREISVAAQRLLQEVHLLASTYGWREADILNLSARRRNAYINQIAGGYPSSSAASPFSGAMGL